MNIRTPYNEKYVKSLGLAVYLFASYEWNIIYIIERLEPGFVTEYCRKNPMTSWKVWKRLEKALEQDTGCHNVDKMEMESCCKEFGILIIKRNALIHAHPITDIDGAQILNYQGELSKLISDKKWKIEEIDEFTEEIDLASSKANNIQHGLKRTMA